MTNPPVKRLYKRGEIWAISGPAGFVLDFAPQRLLRHNFRALIPDGSLHNSLECQRRTFCLGPAMAWFGRLQFVRSSDPLFGAMSLTCCKYFSTKCSWLVSSFGRCRDSSGRLTSGTLHGTGYRLARIHGHRFSVHRIVAFAFLGAPTKCSAWYVHHRDGDAANNRLDNLMYVTHSQNVQSSYEQNPDRGRAGKASSVPVMWRKSGQTKGWNTCPSIRAAAEVLCVSSRTVSRHCQEGTPIGGYEVKFAPPTELEVLEGEVWLPMKNPKTGLENPGRQISSCGRIKSSNGLITRGHQGKSGYFRTHIKDDCNQYSGVYIHSLVAYNFLGPPPSSQHSQVNHKDLNPGNNHVENLEYVTPAENIKHFHANRGYQLPDSPLQKPVLGRPRGGNEDEWVWYKSMTDAAKILGIDVANISRCARGLSKHASDYEFRLADPNEPLQLPGEEWRPVDLEGLLRERAKRMK